YNTVLDLLEEPGVPLTPGFRNQLDRAALSISNNVAESFEHYTTNERLSFIGLAKDCSGEVRSMMAVVKDRPKLKIHVATLQKIRESAESCARQLGSWAGAMDKSPSEGHRHFPEQQPQAQSAGQQGREFKSNSFKQSKPDQQPYKPSE